MDGLCLLSKEGGKERREKTEKRLKRRKRGGGVVVGGAAGGGLQPTAGVVAKVVWPAGVGLPQRLLSAVSGRWISFLCLTFQSRFLSHVV